MAYITFVRDMASMIVYKVDINIRIINGSLFVFIDK